MVKTNPPTRKLPGPCAVKLRMMFTMKPANPVTHVLLVGLCLLGLTAQARSADRKAMLERIKRQTLHAYKGPVVHGVDTKSLHGKVLCGYQGWFTADGDGSGRGWFHWAKNSRRKPSVGNIRVDLWPDLSEFAPDERFVTDVKYADGRAAEVFSSFKKPTVLRHFEWMKEAGIDGVLVQRFATQALSPAGLRQVNVVLDHCREGANRSGRTYAVEYDLSGLGPGQIDGVIADWRDLRRRMHLCDDPAYLHHKGRPVVEVWGIGFNDGRRRYSLDDCRKLVKFLRDDGCHVICGVPTGWRTLSRDAVRDPALLGVLHWPMSSVRGRSVGTNPRLRSPAMRSSTGSPTWRGANATAWSTCRSSSRASAGTTSTTGR